MKRSEARTEYLKDFLLTAMQGCDYWCDVTDYDYDAGTGTLVDDEDVEHSFSLDTIAHGIQVLTTGENAKRSFTMSGADYWKQFKLSNRTNGEDGDYDADIADNVLQAGLFGKVIYG